MSLSYQINIRVFLLALLILMLGFAATIWHAKNAVNKEIGASVKLTAHIMSCGLAQQSANDVKWLECFGLLDETRHLKVEMLKASGEVVKFGKSNDDRQRGLPPAWFIQLISAKQAVIQKQLTTQGGEPLSVKIQADSFDEIKEIWEESVGYLGTMVLLILLTLSAIYGVLHKSVRSINAIVTALQNIQTGNYRQKIPEFTTTEFNSIAIAINQMAMELDKAQQQNRALTQHSLEILEAERRQLAQELHDEFGQSLTAIKFMALTAKQKPSELTQLTETIAGQCDKLIHLVRTLMRQLHPSVLTELGLKAAIEDLVALWSRRNTGLKVKLDCGDAVDKLERTVAIQLFRVIQECLTNIVRHAEATEATISLDIDNSTHSCINLTVKDNGKACPSGQLKQGFGILGMQERIQSLGGGFSIMSSSGSGVTVNARIPV